MDNVSLAKIRLNREDKMCKRLKEVEDACFRAKDLSKQLVTFSKGGEPVKKVTSIEQLIKHSASFALSGPNVSCEFSISKDLWQVEVNEGQLGRVIHNLFKNADEAMPDGGVIRVRVENSSVVTGDKLPLKEGR
jgi:signal transduction histidine kinase